LCFEFFFVHLLVFSFYAMLKIDDRFRYLGHEVDPRSINFFDVNCVFNFYLYVVLVLFFWSSTAKLLRTPLRIGQHQCMF
jgi:hypothetical protein